jgi:hypothetical protein
MGLLARRERSRRKENGIDEPLTPDQPADMRPAAEIAEPPIPAPPAARNWAVFDPRHFRHTSNMAFSVLGSRPASSRTESRGYAIAGGESMALHSGAFLAGGIQEHELRLVPDDALSLSLSRYQLEAGVRLGPLEPMARVGFTTLHIDYGHGFSLGLFTPRVGAGLWLKVGKVRLGASAFTEYFWRWLGDESSWVHGLSFELQLETPMPRPSGPTSWPSPRGRR